MRQFAYSPATASSRQLSSRQACPSRDFSGVSGALLGVAVLLVCAGCTDDWPLHADRPMQFDRGESSSASGALTPAVTLDFPPEQMQHVASAPAVTSRTGRTGTTRLASFANRSKASIQWTFGGLVQSGSEVSGTEGSAVRLVQAPATDVEIVPTPPARPESKGELIATPKGVPPQGEDQQKSVSPVARIAADVEGADTKAASSEAFQPSEKMSTKPELIDPTSDAGLVADQNGPEDYRKWPTPDVVLFVTGNQHGYIEPCGCTGLEKQKGGVARRFTFVEQLRDKGWDLLPIDAGNQIRRIGQQASIKFEQSSRALSEMNYEAVGFGPDDMRLSATDLISKTYADSPEDSMYVSGNVVLLDPDLLPSHKLVRRGEWNVGLTSILDPASLEAPVEDEVIIGDIRESATDVLKKMNAAGANFRVLTFFGEEDAAEQLMVDVPGYDLIVVSGGYGEPTYRPQSIEGSQTKMIVTGNKGMFAGLVGLYQNQAMKYARVPLTHEFKDAPEMRKLMADYQQQLEQLGLEGLGLSPIPHPSGEKFIGTAACAKCHEGAFDVWEGSGHAHATDDIVEPTEGRGDVPRHFDPECISCHVTGWNPQNYYPYESGYLSLEKSAHLTGSGCENCHGPGAGHAAAEAEGSGASDARKESLRIAMQLPLDRAKEHCMKCHDLDNSPDFHEDGAFEDVYWPEVEH